MPRTFKVSNQKEISCAMHSDLNAEWRWGRNSNWRRLNELRFELSKPPRSIKVALHPLFPAPPWTFLSIWICPWVVFSLKYCMLGRSLLLIYQTLIYCCQERTGTANRIHISNQKEISCAMRSNLDAERRLRELKWEFIESPPITTSMWTLCQKVDCAQDTQYMCFWVLMMANKSRWTCLCFARFHFSTNSAPVNVQQIPTFSLFLGSHFPIKLAIFYFAHWT